MLPILLDLSLPILTQRLAIRPVQPGDGKQLFAQVDSNRKELSKWLPWVDFVRCEEDSEITARTFYADFILRKAFHFTVCLNDQIIGGVGLSYINWKIRRMNLGYWCSAQHQGKGYITEAISAMTDFAFYQLNGQKLQILCDSENIKSIGVAERCGFVLESEALGMLDHPGNGELRLGRRYAKYNQLSNI